MYFYAIQVFCIYTHHRDFCACVCETRKDRDKLNIYIISLTLSMCMYRCFRIYRKARDWANFPVTAEFR